MNVKMLLLGITAATVAVSACATAPVHGPATLTEASEAFGANVQQYDLKAPNGGRILLDLGNNAPSAGRSIQALKEDVAKYAVSIASVADPGTSLLDIDVFVNPTNSSRSKVAFLGLQPGEYVLTVHAFDRAGNDVTLGGSYSENVLVKAAKMHLASITVQLTETYLNLPGGGVTRGIDANSGEVIEQGATPEASANTGDEPTVFDFADLETFLAGSAQFDDESSFELRPAGFQATHNRTYTAFTTNANNGNLVHLPGAQIIHHNLNPLVQLFNVDYRLRILEVRFGDRAFWLAFNDSDTSNPRMSLRGISKAYNLADGPSQFRWVDIEQQQDAKFFGTATPAGGIDTSRYYFLYRKANANDYAPIVTVDVDKNNGGGIVNITMPDPDDGSRILHIQALDF